MLLHKKCNNQLFVNQFSVLKLTVTLLYLLLVLMLSSSQFPAQIHVTHQCVIQSGLTRMDGQRDLGFHVTVSTQTAAISCLRRTTPETKLNTSASSHYCKTLENPGGGEGESGHDTSPYPVRCPVVWL